MNAQSCLLALGVWLLVAFAVWRKSGREQVVLLGVACVASGLLYFDFGRFHGEGRFVHDHELFHHTMGSEYLPEVGHKGLYSATCFALVENGLGEDELPERVTNLWTNALESSSMSLERGASVKAQFSAERWSEFCADIAFFDGRVGLIGWSKILVDHGHNASPFWTSVGAGIAGVLGLSDASLLLMSLLDLALLLAMGLALRRVFGIQVALLFCTFYFANVFAPFTITGGAFLRHMWLAGVVGFACCMQTGKGKLGAVFLAIATLDRIFPAVLILWPVFLALRELRSSRQDEPRSTLGLQTLGVFLVLVGAGIASTGVAAWTAFFENVVAHGRGFFINQISLRNLFTVNPATASTIIETDALWIREREQLAAQSWLALWGIRVLGAALVFVCAWRARGNLSPIRALVCLSLLPFVLAYPANYYHVFLGLALLDFKGLARVLIASQVLLWAVAFYLYSSPAPGALPPALAYVELFNWCVSLVLALGATFFLARSIHPKAGLAASLLLGLAVLGYGTAYPKTPERLDLIPSDLTGAKVITEDMTRWGNGWSRGDQVVVMATAPGQSVKCVLGTPQGYYYGRLRFDFTQTPAFGRVTVRVYGQEIVVDLYSPKVGIVSVVTERIEIYGDEVEVEFVVEGKHPASSNYFIGIDKIGLERSASRSPQAALDRAQSWLDNNPVQAVPVPNPDRDLAALAALLSEQTTRRFELTVKGEPDPQLSAGFALTVEAMLRAYDFVEGIDPATAAEQGLVLPKGLESWTASLLDGLRWSVALRDTITTARLLILAQRAGASPKDIYVQAAADSLVVQQREDGSFGPVQPNTPEPYRMGVELAIKALDGL